jgi:hypothetical protein
LVSTQVMSATECKGLPAISGGKPLLQAKGLQSCVDTNGSNPWLPSPHPFGVKNQKLIFLTAIFT